MKKQIVLLFGMAFFLLSCGQGPVETASDAKGVENTDRPVGAAYDSLLARELGADDYGMKVYVMALLYRGDANGLDSLQRAKLQRAHLDNISRMAEAGELVLAGPFMDGQDLRGIYVFDVRTVAEAEALTNTDPAIQAGTLKMELRPWYGSAALMKANELHEQVARIDI